MRLIDADALKERIQSKYTFAIASEVGYEIDKTPMVKIVKDRISEKLLELGEEIKSFYQSPLGDNLYFICRLATDREKYCDIALIRNEKHEYFMSKTGIERKCEIKLLPTTLDDTEDYIMEFYPEEYARIKPILDAEREKSAKNKKE